ncbi:hypothetical protein C8R42DRAFT_644572 [Lentinula raphanica]|nr:hypothetical protein C8R42DRAFT_644572 [Lentinula raphanica]
MLLYSIQVALDGHEQNTEAQAASLNFIKDDITLLNWTNNLVLNEQKLKQAEFRDKATNTLDEDDKDHCKPVAPSNIPVSEPSSTSTTDAATQTTSAGDEQQQGAPDLAEQNVVRAESHPDPHAEPRGLWAVLSPSKLSFHISRHRPRGSIHTALREYPSGRVVDSIPGVDIEDDYDSDSDERELEKEDGKGGEKEGDESGSDDSETEKNDGLTRTLIILDTVSSWQVIARSK